MTKKTNKSTAANDAELPVLDGAALLSGNPQEVRAPELGGRFYVRQLSARWAMEWAELPDDTDERKAVKKDKQFELVARALAGADGQPLYSEEELPEAGRRLPPGVVFRALPLITGGMGVEGEVDAGNG